MEADRKRWNEKYQERGAAGQAAPDEFFLACLTEVLGRRGRALDLASGTGRHALELARQGWDVVAWDVSEAALEVLETSAAREELALETRRVDLDEPLPGGEFDLVVLVNYLDRGLLERARSLLRVGGCLLFTTFTRDRAGDHPSDRWCLEPGELQQGVPGFETLLSRESGGRAGWLGRRSG